MCTYWSPDPTTSASSCSSSFYSKADFDQAKQDKYKAAVANAAGTTADKVDILSITEGRRLKVETKVSRLRARNSCPACGMCNILAQALRCTRVGDADPRHRLSGC